MPGREQSAGYLPGPPPAPREGSVRGAVSCEASHADRVRGSRRGSAGKRRSLAGRRDGPIMSWAGWTGARRREGTDALFSCFCSCAAPSNLSAGNSGPVFLRLQV